MGNNFDKIKNSTRRFQDEIAVKKQLDIIKSKSWNTSDSKSIAEPHRLVKRKAMDCGVPNCSLCGNPRRNPWNKKEKLTAQEQRFYQDIDNINDRKSNGIKPNEESENNETYFYKKEV